MCKLYIYIQRVKELYKGRNIHKIPWMQFHVRISFHIMLLKLPSFTPMIKGLNIPFHLSTYISIFHLHYFSSLKPFIITHGSTVSLLLRSLIIITITWLLLTQEPHQSDCSCTGALSCIFSSCSAGIVVVVLIVAIVVGCRSRYSGKFFFFS